MATSAVTLIEQSHSVRATFRARGVGRFVVAGFLGFWLSGWLAGELVVLGLLVGTVGSMLGVEAFQGTKGPFGVSPGAAVLILCFCGVWLLFWTLGGIAAIKEFFRSLFGKDELTLDAKGLRWKTTAGPLRRERFFRTEDIEWVGLTARKQLVLESPTETVTLATFGKPQELANVRDALRRHLGQTDSAQWKERCTRRAPQGYEVSREGATLVLGLLTKTRVVTGWILVGVLGLLLWGWVKSLERQSGGLALFLGVLSALVLLEALRLLFCRPHWRFQEGEAVWKTDWLGVARERRFTAPWLSLTRSEDSDGDYHFSLKLMSANGEKTIVSAINDSRPPLRVATFIAHHTGYRLEQHPSLAQE